MSNKTKIIIAHLLEELEGQGKEALESQLRAISDSLHREEVKDAKFHKRIYLVEIISDSPTEEDMEELLMNTYMDSVIRCNCLTNEGITEETAAEECTLSGADPAFLGITDTE